MRLSIFAPQKTKYTMELFKVLSSEEQQQLLDAIPLIAILVAGADGKIDQQELYKAEKVAEIRSYSHHHELRSFYEKAQEDLGEKLYTLIEELPNDVAERQELISGMLRKLNKTLRKLDTHAGHILYDSFLSFARHVAKASGGVIGIFSINAEEKKVIDLPMLEPIIK